MGNPYYVSTKERRNAHFKTWHNFTFCFSTWFVSYLHYITNNILPHMLDQLSNVLLIRFLGVTTTSQFRDVVGSSKKSKNVDKVSFRGVFKMRRGSLCFEREAQAFPLR